MKIDRLIGIITVLQNNKKVTAPYLAERFEVSRRTINRDIEDICKAGVPLVTLQGGNGGVSIMEGYSLDNTVFTKEELQAVFIGLKSLDSVSNTSYSEKLARKIPIQRDASSPLNTGGMWTSRPTDNISIDLSSYYKDSLATKIELLNTAINERKLISFHYYYNKGEADKLIEPYQIVFRWFAWYIFGYCVERKDFRMYKLNRLWDLQVTDTIFPLREIPKESADFDSHMSDDYQITALFEESEKYRLVEEYGVSSYSETKEGKLLFKREFTNLAVAISWFLSFGDKVEVVEPKEMRECIKVSLRTSLNKYNRT